LLSHKQKNNFGEMSNNQEEMVAAGEEQEGAQTKQQDMEQQELRKKIISIQKDNKYNAKEKQQLIFALFNKAHNNHDSHNKNGCCSSKDTVKSLLTSLPVTSDDKYILGNAGTWIHIPCSQIHPTIQSGRCDHYKRECSIYTECCRKFFSCRRCHDRDTDHVLESKDVKVIRCHTCSQIQLASNKCANSMCQTVFGEYYCATCKLWEVKDSVYHCDKCDVCIRIEDKQNVHCDTCGYCMPLARYTDHVCEKLEEEICVICSEDFAGCLGDVERTKCGHIYHISCMEKYIVHDVCCPMCRKTLFDMSKTWDEMDELKSHEVIPEDFQHWRVKYKCNDCQQMSEGKFSVYGHKCCKCGGYNTTQDAIIRDEPAAPTNS
jgi:hypothetical protein